MNIYKIMAILLLILPQYVAAEEMKSETFNCSSKDGKTTGQVFITIPGRFENTVLNYCSGGYYETEPTDCQEVTTRYEYRKAVLSLTGQDSLEKEFEILRGNDPFKKMSHWWGATRFQDQKGYDISLDFVENGYRLWIRVFRDFPFKSEELYRFGMKCELMNN